jgi:hypothetical protein
MSRHLATLAVVSIVLAAGVVMLAGAFALRAINQRSALRLWVPTAAEHPAWAEALAGSEPQWQVSRPTSDSLMVEYQIGSDTASLYTAAMRERDVASAELSQQAFLAAQLQALSAVPTARPDFVVGDEAAYLVAAGELVAVARRGRAVLVLNASGLAVPEAEVLAEIFETQLARILATPPR